MYSWLEKLHCLNTKMLKGVHSRMRSRIDARVTASLILLICLLSGNSSVYAWDSVGHRTAGAIAYEFLSTAHRAELIAILEQHPRFAADFLNAMPAGLDNSVAGRQLWLLGQAAYWPDIARGLPEAEQRRYSRPTWHYTDGAWIRGVAAVQGNNYVGVDIIASVQGEASSTIVRESQVHNISTAIDFNAFVFNSPESSAPQRAIALCWLLHLMSDIHQPLHTGSLFSRTLFETGDRGGNRIATGEGNLHYRWDAALSGNSLQQNADDLLQFIEQEGPSLRRQADLQTGLWDLWLHESRQLLSQHVYTPRIRNAIGRAESGDGRLDAIDLDQRYVATMEDIAARQLALAGLRMANWFSQALGDR